jgi:hypothetical protein
MRTHQYRKARIESLKSASGRAAALLLMRWHKYQNFKALAFALILMRNVANAYFQFYWNKKIERAPLLLVETIKLYYEAIKYIEKYTLDKQYFITLQEIKEWLEVSIWRSTISLRTGGGRETIYHQSVNRLSSFGFLI